MISESWTKIIGIFALGLASTSYVLFLLAWQSAISKPGQQDGGLIWGLIYTLVPFTVFLGTGLALAAARGALDWLALAPATRYLLIFATAICLGFATFFAALGTLVPTEQIPWAMRPISGWSPFVLPPIFLIGGWLCFLQPEALNHSSWLMWTFSAAALTSLMTGFGATAEWALQSHRRDRDKVEEILKSQSERDLRILEEVRAMDPVRDFAELLGFTNRFENEEIRRESLRKALSHPDFPSALEELLRSPATEKALVYLDTDEARPEDLRLAAKTFRDSVAHLTRQAADDMERTHTFYPEQFDWNTRLILSVADKIKPLGVDPVPDVRLFREALQTPRTESIRLDAKGTLDRWLTKAKGKR